MIFAPRQVGETHLAKKLISEGGIGGGGMIIFDMGMVFQDLELSFCMPAQCLGAWTPPEPVCHEAGEYGRPIVRRPVAMGLLAARLRGFEALNPD
jgi:hypothetical protein